jgi:hypothetical protein
MAEGPICDRFLPPPSFPLLSWKNRPAHAQSERHVKSRLETETQKGRSTREGSALFMIPDDIESHSDSGGKTSSEREVMLRYC